MRDDQRSGAEDLVAFGVVVVPVRVDRVRDGLAAELRDPVTVQRHILGITRVDDERAAVAEQHEHVTCRLAAAGAVQHVQPRLDLFCRDCRRARRLLRARRAQSPARSAH